MTTLYTAIVGSTLHGLDTSESDLDIREVYMLSPREALNPFPEPIEVAQTEGKDFATFELAKFIKMCVKGNPTALEILWSNKVEYITPEFQKFKDNKRSFLDSNSILEAHCGYIDAAIKDLGNDLLSPKRHRKAYIAGCRIFLQASQLLTTGDFSPKLDPMAIHQLMPIKKLNNDPITRAERDALAGKLAYNIRELRFLTAIDFTPNLFLIRNLVYNCWGI